MAVAASASARRRCADPTRTCFAVVERERVGGRRGGAGRAVLPFDDVTADRYAHVLVAQENAGAPISTADAQIAAICLVHRATCATRNVKDFVHTGVELVDPWNAHA